jgi:hypothetical protein
MESEEKVYLIEGEFAFKSYQPEKLKEGMHFLHKITVGTMVPQFDFFTLTHVPDDEDMFMSLYGAPVKLLIISKEDQSVLVKPKHIGWFSDDEAQKLHPITDKEINEILNVHDSIMDLECTEDGDILIYQGKVIISYLSSEEEEEVEDGDN